MDIDIDLALWESYFLSLKVYPEDSNSIYRNAAIYLSDCCLGLGGNM